MLTDEYTDLKATFPSGTIQMFITHSWCSAARHTSGIRCTIASSLCLTTYTEAQSILGQSHTQPAWPCRFKCICIRSTSPRTPVLSSYCFSSLLWPEAQSPSHLMSIGGWHTNTETLQLSLDFQLIQYWWSGAAALDTGINLWPKVSSARFYSLNLCSAHEKRNAPIKHTLYKSSDRFPLIYISYTW